MTDFLLTLKEHLKEIKQRISVLLEDWDDAQIVLSLLGAGDTVVGRFLWEIESIDRFPGSDPLSLYLQGIPATLLLRKIQKRQNQQAGKQTGQGCNNAAGPL